MQNTLFGGEIVHNKNSEDPAHFILRLKSLNKAVPTYDLAGSSNGSISDSSEKVNPSGENSSKKSSINHALPTNPDGNPDASTHLTQDHIETVRIATKQALENMGMQDTELGNNAGSDQVLANALKKFKEQQYGSRGERIPG